jgi:DNA-binding NarL/FixJ family response regulator
LVASGADADKGRELAIEARAEFERLDMPGPMQGAHALLAELDTDAGSPLSAREREVAELVSRPLSNREIAQRLVLSERTVETHVRNILTKLGFSSRTEIVAWVLRAPAS